MASSSYAPPSGSMRARAGASISAGIHSGHLEAQYSAPPSAYGKAHPAQRPGSPQLKRHAQQQAASPGPLALWNMGRQELKTMAALTAVACLFRLWRLSAPSSVVFDEVHFGGFASKYIKRHFFMDVHPPLAKLLFTLVAWLAGFDGKFDFADIGKEYLVGEHTPVPYVAMRTMPAVLGVATIPIAYVSLRALGLRITSALLGALAVLFDNALTTQSRLILLDSPLVFFTATTAMIYITFANADKRAPFTKPWWTWLFATGLSLGAVASCKWVGFFTVATVGLCTVVQLWSHLGDTRLPMSQVGRHFSARVLGLICVPFLFYYCMFGIHLSILSWGGDGDPFLSPEFQHTLNDHNMNDTFADVSLGSTVTIRHVNTHGGYLHSHNSNYPSGSQQQQITLYPHADHNNEWVLVPAPPEHKETELDKDGVPIAKNNTVPDYQAHLGVPLEFVTHGMEVRLVHKSTLKRLHSHDDYRPPLTESDFQNEVTAYGFVGFPGDHNDNWVVEIEAGEPIDPVSTSRLRALRSVFRLRHSLTDCYLFSHKVVLPDWGFHQQEVTCNKDPTMPNSLWFIETNTHPLLERARAHNLSLDEARQVNKGRTPEMHNYLRPSFWKRFWELNSIMWSTNKGLTNRHAYDSRPHQWPFLRRGILFWVKGHRQIYLLGNPVVWWSASVSVLAYVAMRGLLMLRAKRGYRDFNNSTVIYYDRIAAVAFTGWALHYLPFFIMHRQLFIHHYLPALYFSILLLATVFDLATSALRPQARLGVAAVFLFLVFIAFNTYSPLVYGSRWTSAACERSKLLKTWDYDCNSFPESKAEYSGFETHVKLGPEHLVHVSSSASSAGKAGVKKPGKKGGKGKPVPRPRPPPPPPAGVAPADHAEHGEEHHAEEHHAAHEQEPEHEHDHEHDDEDEEEHIETTPEGAKPEFLPEPAGHAFDEAPIRPDKSVHAAAAGPAGHPLAAPSQGQPQGGKGEKGAAPAPAAASASASGAVSPGASAKPGPAAGEAAAAAAADKVKIDIAGLDAGQLANVALEGTQKGLADARKQALKEAEAAAKAKAQGMGVSAVPKVSA